MRPSVLPAARPLFPVAPRPAFPIRRRASGFAATPATCRGRTSRPSPSSAPAPRTRDGLDAARRHRRRPRARRRGGGQRPGARHRRRRASGGPRRGGAAPSRCSGPACSASTRRSTRRLADADCSTPGAVISEYPPDTPPHAGALPAAQSPRQRSCRCGGRGRGAGEERRAHHRPHGARSGQGRDGRAGPRRRVTATGAATCLIRDGAKLVESADDILLEMSWTATRAPDPARLGSPELADFTVDDVVAARRASRRSGAGPAACSSSWPAKSGGLDPRRFLRVRSRVLT